MFAFQIVPGSNELLGYCATMEEAVTEAAVHRIELIKDQALDDEAAEGVSPIFIYELRLKPLKTDLVLPVLNRRQELAEVLLEEMTRVGVVE